MAGPMAGGGGRLRAPWLLVALAAAALAASWRLSRGLGGAELPEQGEEAATAPLPAETAELHLLQPAVTALPAAQPPAARSRPPRQQPAAPARAGGGVGTPAAEATRAGGDAAHPPAARRPATRQPSAAPARAGGGVRTPAAEATGAGSEGGAGCAPPHFGGLTAPEPASEAGGDKPRRSLAEEISGASLAWCDDGYTKNGEFSLLAGGETAGDFSRWGLHRWSSPSEQEVLVDDGGGGNPHRLVFNCQRTGFYVAGRGQRGYVLGRGYTSPDVAGAPLWEQAPDCAAEAADAASAGSAALEAGKVPVWVWWDFRGSVGNPNAVPVTFRLNLRTWRRHLQPDRFSLHLLNASNIRRFLPDLPEAFFRMYHAAKTDFLRAALIAAHGGVYLDGDILLVRDLHEVVGDLLDGRADVMPYEGPGDRCPSTYTTNFMAGAKGNPLSTRWIETTLAKMANRCSLPESENHREPVKVCCYNADWCPRAECHVAWGDISHPPSLRDFAEGEVRMNCIPFRSGFAHTMTGEELFWPLAAGASEGGGRQCWRDPGPQSPHLRCTGLGRLDDYFGRHGYHLYNMLHGATSLRDSEEGVLESRTVVGELYRLSLGLAE